MSEYNKSITADELRELVNELDKGYNPKTTIEIFTYIDDDGVERCLQTGKPFSEIKKWMEE